MKFNRSKRRLHEERIIGIANTSTLQDFLWIIVDAYNRGVPEPEIAELITDELSVRMKTDDRENQIMKRYLRDVMRLIAKDIY